MTFAKLSVFNFTASQLRAVEEYAKASSKFRDFLLRAVQNVENCDDDEVVSDYRDFVLAKLPKSATEPTTKAKSTKKPKARSTKKSTKAESFDLKSLLVEAVEATMAKLSQADEADDEADDDEEAVKPTKSKKSTTKAKPKADEVDDEAEEAEEAKVTRYHYFASGPVSKVDQRNLPWLVSASRKPGEDIFVRFGYRAKSFQSASFPIKRLREAIQKHSARLLSELDEAEEQLS